MTFQARNRHHTVPVSRFAGWELESLHLSSR
jgi:hypothetical protein